jgi:hypothetical protein
MAEIGDHDAWTCLDDFWKTFGCLLRDDGTGGGSMKLVRMLYDLYDVG